MSNNLYQANLIPFIGEKPDITFRNSRIDLNIYYSFLLDIKEKLNQSNAISVELEKINIGEKDDINSKTKGEQFIYRLIDNPKTNSKKIDEIKKILFHQNVKYLYPTKETKWHDKIEIIDRNGEEDLLYFKEDLGEKEKLYIRQDDYQIKKQMDAITRLRDRPLKEHLPLIQLFENPYYQKMKNIKFSANDVLSEEEDWEILKDRHRDGTNQQRTFVKKALATSDFALLEGPPGSGKTTTIIELIIQLCKLGKRVLLVSSTHVAVDNVLKRILTSYKKDCENWVAPLRIARDKNQIRYDEVKPYRLQELEYAKIQGVKKHLRERPQRNESQEKLLKSLNSSKVSVFFKEAILDASNLVCGTMIGILQHPLIKDKTIDVPFDVMIVDEASKVTFQEFLVPALYAKKWILVGDVQQLSPYVEDDYVEMALSKLLPEETKKHLQTLHPIWKAAQSDKNQSLKILLSNDFDKIEAKKVFKSHLEVFDFDLEFKHRNNDVLKLNASDIILAKNTPKNRVLLEKHIFVKAKVYDNQINGEFSRVQKFHKNKNFNYPRNDKSTWEHELAHRLSQYYSFRSDRKLGRHLQKDIDFLIPKDIIVNQQTTLKEQIEQIKQITMPSILEMLQNGLGQRKNKRGREINRILYDGLPKEAIKLKFVSLEFQHRMEDALAKTSRKHFYKGNLKTSSSIETRKNPLFTYKKGEAKIVWETNNHRSKYSKNGHRKNDNEIETQHIITEIHHFLDWSKTASPKDDSEAFEVAVLCFYRDQEALVRRKLQQLFREKNKAHHLPNKNFHFKKENVKITLCTVDKFQGDEADMVLLSFSKATPNAFYKSPNRLNVALTRARYKLVLFGNHKFFAERNVSDALTTLAEDFRPRLSSKIYKNAKNKKR